MTDGKTIDEKTVNHVARLSHIKLSEEEVHLYRRQLAAILGYISKLNEIDTAKIPPMSHPMENLKDVFRKDVAGKSLSVEEAFQNAPKRKDNFFSVPKIME